MSETLYVQIEKNIKITDPHVHLEDVARLACSDSETLVSLRTLPIYNIPGKRPGRYVLNVMDIIEKIQKKNSNVDVNHMGEPTFVVTYAGDQKEKSWMQWMKIVGICLTAFFGAAFSIMTFNNDVNTTGLFGEIYQFMTGKIPTGATILEYAYSIGIGLGVLFFFNHFGKRKLTQDPTPMEVKMRLYEDDVNTTILEDNKKGADG